MIVVLDYGMGNIHSILKALQLFYDNVVFTNNKNKIADAKGLVLPGDGHFYTAMKNLSNIQEIIYKHIEKGKLLLGICIGFQILFEDSNEVLKNSKELTVKGLNIIPGKIRKFENTSFRIPHMGWNQLIPEAKILKDCPSFYKDYMYFIHSYRPVDVSEKYVLTWTEYANELFPSTVRKENVWGCQYHPEKSDFSGLAFLKNWIKHL